MTTESPAICWECDEGLTDNEACVALGKDDEDVFCESCIQNFNEAAWEAQNASYYGGGGPVTVREQQTKAWEGKR